MMKQARQREAQEAIEAFWKSPSSNPSPNIRNNIIAVIDALDKGRLRVAQCSHGEWTTNAWIKQAVLAAFKIWDNQPMHAAVGGSTGPMASAVAWFDKVPSKFGIMNDAELAEVGARIVPPAVARYGSYVAPGVIMMPSFINIGAYVANGTMVDTWATVGSCAQIGENCHLSGGVGIGGVLEPLQATPTIIEDNVFVGARSEIVEGVIVRKNSVIGMGCFIGQSTPIVNRETGEITFGEIPEGSVVIDGGFLPYSEDEKIKDLPENDVRRRLVKPCVQIVKQVDEKTRSKTAINELLRA
jgi:2,3,4,5-tetrahydropyridine-2-carboxylate N-succinyltransferase